MTTGKAIVEARRGGARASTAVPHKLRAKAVSAGLVLLAWRGPSAAHHASAARHRSKHGRAHRYRVYRDGRLIAETREPRFTDADVQPATAYRYRVGLHARGRKPGQLSRAVKVRTLTVACTPAAISRGKAPKAGAPPFAITPRTPMTIEMVERLFWRAGFGPRDADRHAWMGRRLGDLVEWLLTAPQSYAATDTPPATDRGVAIDPLVTNTELVLEWLDRMQRATNPLPQRMNFFWHRHWAVTRQDGVPAHYLLAYRDRLYRYSDFAANPQANFRSLALEMTTQDAAMSKFLNGNQNVRAKPNENYAREFMELFCLGVADISGNPNYSQADVQQLARAFTGWRLDGNASSPSYGRVSFDPRFFDSASKTILGQTGTFDAAAAVDVVLGHRSHAPHMVAKLWSEFIATPIPPATLAELSASYARGGLLLAPLIREILTHPLIFESLCEPNLIKPPIVHTVGVLRALGVPLRGGAIPGALSNMQQLPYSPPNVAGWEGGASWLNSNTAAARFDLIVRCQNLKYASQPPADLPREKPHQAFTRAWASVGAPWLSPEARSVLEGYARTAPSANASQRRQRFYALQASMLGGPDGQVM